MDKWNKYNKKDPRTYPPDKYDEYLVIVNFRGVRQQCWFEWLGNSKRWGEYDGAVIQWKRETITGLGD